MAANRNVEEYQRVQAEQPELVRGSGMAAVLLFLHIALLGYLAYAVYVLLKHAHWNVGTSATTRHFVVFSAAFTLQFYIPAWFAGLSYFPSDPLTRTVGRVALAAGATALLGGTAIFLLNSIDQTPEILTGIFVGAGAAVLFAEFFRTAIPKRGTAAQPVLPPFGILPPFGRQFAFIVLAVIWTVVAVTPDWYPNAVTYLLAGLGGVLLLWRVAAGFLHRRP